jgi:hypothetical protein
LILTLILILLLQGWQAGRQAGTRYEEPITNMWHICGSIAWQE